MDPNQRKDLNQEFWKDKKVVVAGGGGFIGSHLVEHLIKHEARVRVFTRTIDSARSNLRNSLDKVELLQGDLKRAEDASRAVKNQEVVLNLLGEVGGIEYNKSRHGSTFLANMLPNLTLLEAARLENVDRYECTSSTCVYSREKSVNSREEDGFVDDPEPTVVGYGWAKRIAELQARLYAKDYGMKIAIVRAANAYGPRDDFRPNTSHVIPALIRRVIESKSEVEVWGSGKQTRSFVYADDIASGIMAATELYAVADPVNLGSEEEISVTNLIELIIQLLRRKIQIRYDLTKPEGQPRKVASIVKAKEVLNWHPIIPLRVGLERTISWFMAQ
jgi:GDP-L-fucose synthase